MDDRFIALHDFYSMFVHGVFKLLFSNKFLSDQWLPYVSINIDIPAQLRGKRKFPCCLLCDSAQAFCNVFFNQSNNSAFLSKLNNIAPNTQCSLDFVKFIVNICEQTTNFFSLTRCFLDFFFFFPEVMLEIGGVAYTQVRLIHKSLRYYTLCDPPEKLHDPMPKKINWNTHCHCAS